MRWQTFAMYFAGDVLFVAVKISQGRLDK